MIHLRALTPDDACAIGRVEAAVHKQALADGADRHRLHLADACGHDVNLSTGAFDGDELVGYTLCYGVEPAVFPGASGDAIYIEDIAVLPRYRASVAGRLLKRVFHDVREVFPGLPIEGHSLRSIVQIWQKHPTFFDRIGFTLQPPVESGEVIDGEARYLVRWEPATDAEARRHLQALLERLPGTTIDADGHVYECKVVRDEDDWLALAPVWDELLLSAPEHTVFQTFAYQRLWWRHFGEDGELCIVVLVRNGVVEGIAPLQITPAERLGRACRTLGFIGSRWQVDRPTFLFPRHADTLIQVLVRFLASRADRWDICELYEQRAETGRIPALQAAFRAAGYWVATSEDSACPYLMLDGSWAEFLATRSSLFRKNLKTAGRRVREHGDVQCRLYETAPDVLAQLEIYRDIESRSWKSEKGVGMSRSDDYFAFHRDLAEVFAKDGRFLVRMLTVDGKAIAGTFGLEYDGVFYSLQIAHDRDYARCSPGTYLESLEMEECFARNREYEFLGGFLNNKSRWTSTFRLTKQLHVYRRTPFGTAAYVLLHQVKPWVKERIRPYMKSWRQRTPAAVPSPPAE